MKVVNLYVLRFLKKNKPLANHFENTKESITKYHVNAKNIY